MIYKIFLFAMLSCMALLMSRTVILARRFKTAGKSLSSVGVHRRTGLALWVTTLVFLLMVEGKRAFGAPIIHDGLFYAHVSCASLFFLALSAILFFGLNGNKFGYHRQLGYICAGAFVPAAITGYQMILRMKI